MTKYAGHTPFSIKRRRVANRPEFHRYIMSNEGMYLADLRTSRPWDSADWPTDDDMEKIACLMVAAPDLHEACAAFVEAWEKSLQLEKTDVALRKAKAALALANGGE